MIYLRLWNSGFLLSGGDYNQKTGFFQFLFSATVICRDLWLAQIAQDIDVMPLMRNKWVSQKNRPGQSDRARYME
jgi:hypothetical protein